MLQLRTRLSWPFVIIKNSVFFPESWMSSSQTEKKINGESIKLVANEVNMPSEMKKHAKSPSYTVSIFQTLRTQ